MAEEEGGMDDPGEPAPTPEMLIASVLHLMSHYLAAIDNAGSRVNLSLAIERHFHTLAARSDLGPVLRGTCWQLSEQWGPLAATQQERRAARAAPPSVLARLLGRGN